MASICSEEETLSGFTERMADDSVTSEHALKSRMLLFSRSLAVWWPDRSRRLRVVSSRCITLGNFLCGAQISSPPLALYSDFAAIGMEGRWGSNMTTDTSRAPLPTDTVVPIESVLCTEDLEGRPSRPPHFETKNRALTAVQVDELTTLRPMPSPSEFIVTFPISTPAST